MSEGANGVSVVRLLTYEYSLPARSASMYLTLPADLDETELAEIEQLFRVVVRSQLRRLQAAPPSAEGA